MREIILLAHTSLDGFVAGENGELDGFQTGSENLAFVNQIVSEAKTFLAGRKTYELLDAYWPGVKDLPGASSEEIAYSNWYNNADKLIVSTTLSNINRDQTTILSKNILQQIKDIRQQTGEAIALFGSPSITQLLMTHNLIDIYWIFVNPVLFGKGIPLFKNADPKISLKLSAIKQLSNGELAIKYVRI